MNIKDEIKKTIETNDTCLFMKGTPDSPQCGFSIAVSNLLVTDVNVSMSFLTKAISVRKLPF